MDPKTHQPNTIEDEDDDFDVQESSIGTIDELSWNYYYPPLDANGGWAEINIPIVGGIA